jgi:hypothetical protein
VTDIPRDQDPDGTRTGRDVRRPRAHDPADEPITGPPSGAATSPTGSASASTSAVAGAGSAASPSSVTGASGGAGANAPGASAGSGANAAPLSEKERRERRRRRFFVGGIAVGAALVVIALCAGTLSIIAAVSGYRDHREDARENRALRDSECLALEQQLNRLVPPGATATPQTRAVAVRDENAAVRIYVALVRHQRDQDAWRQVLEARTAYAEALDLQAKSRTPALYVAPRAPDGRTVTDLLIQWSPASCAGPIRRLAAPDL